MGKGVMLKKKGGENIYPVTASDLVYDPITKKNVKEELGGKVEEAPKNDKQYARVNGTWAEVESGAVSEVALIALTPANSDLNGASVKVSTKDGEILLDTVWNGAILSVQIQNGLQYTVTVGDKENYITPEPKTYIAEGGIIRTINMVYVESRLTLNILSNQNNDITIASVKALAKIGIKTINMENGDSIKLPLNTDVTIQFPEVEGYKTPEPITFNSSGEHVIKTATYQTEIVNVTLSSEGGSDIVGQAININGKEYIWDGNPFEVKIPFDTNYNVSLSEKEGYSPMSSSDYIANQVNRQLNLQYFQIKSGIHIIGVSNKMYTGEEWNNQEAPNGISVVTDECRFILSLNYVHAEYKGTWADGNSSVISGVTKTTSRATAISDYNGKGNTEVMLNHYLTEERVAKYCHEFIFPNGKNGYLGAAGEWDLILKNFDLINEMLNLCGGETFITTGTFYTFQWTSTAYDIEKSWMLRFSDMSIVQNHRSSLYCNPRPLCEL